MTRMTTPRNLLGILRETVRQRRITPTSVEAYARLLLQTDEGDPMVPAAHHRLWLELLCNWEIEKLLILAPPEAAKTSWVVSAFIGCYVGVFPESQVILVSSDSPTARKRSDALRAMAKSWAWRAAFPGVEPVSREGLRWTMNEWSLAPEGAPFPGRLHPTVSAFGTGGAIVGSRANILLADDLLTMTNTRTDIARREMRDWVHSSFLSRRKARVSRVVVIGTPWHVDDAYADFQRAGDWVIAKTPLLQEEGNGEVVATLTYPDDFTGRRLGEPVGDQESILTRV